MEAEIETEEIKYRNNRLLVSDGIQRQECWLVTAYNGRSGLSKEDFIQQFEVLLSHLQQFFLFMQFFVAACGIVWC